MSAELEQLRRLLFYPENHDLNQIEVIEKQLIDCIYNQSPNIYVSDEVRNLAKFLRRQCRKKYMYWRFPPKINHVSHKVAGTIRSRYDDKDKDKEKGLLE